MLSAERPTELIEIAQRLETAGASGFLLSGGCTEEGYLPLQDYLGAVKEIKETTHLRINAHVGYPKASDIAPLVDSGIDVFSINDPINDRIGAEVLRLSDALTRYRETITSLRAAGAPKVTPHFLIGLGDHGEDIVGIERLSRSSPEALIVLAFLPLRGTPMGDRPSTSSTHIIEVLVRAKNLMPETRLTLGCMRPRGLVDMECYLMENILDGIVMPARQAEARTCRTIRLKREVGCCALYL